jgi:hypothetical protein
MPLITFGIYNIQNIGSLSDKAALKYFLDEVFRSDKVLFDKIRSALLEFHKDEGGSPEVHDFEITDCWYDETSKTGGVRFIYQVFFTFGCADIYPFQKSAETSKFSIGLPGSKLLLRITDYIPRDTVDEF